MDASSHIPNKTTGSDLYVRLHKNGTQFIKSYTSLFTNTPAQGCDKGMSIKWHYVRYNELGKSKLEKMINSIPWDKYGTHSAYIYAEGILVKKALDAMSLIYSEGMKCSDKWWHLFKMACHYVAALRDYHDFRMGLTKEIYKTHRYLFEDNGSTTNYLRHYTHVFRIWNWLVFPYELRKMIESGTNYIPRSVVQILIQGKNKPYITREKLTSILEKINNLHRKKINQIEKN